VPDATFGSLAAGLTEAQRQAVLSDAAPLCVLAGAGSGKTTVLTRRVARRVLDGSASAERTMVVTFTRKAADELRARLGRLEVPGRVWAGTFHAAAFAQLRMHHADRRLPAPVLLDDPGRLLRDGEVTGRELDAAQIAGVVGELQWAQSRLVDPGRYEEAASSARRRTPLAYAEIASCYRRYVDAKRARGLLDLGDLLTEAARILEDDAAAAEALRWRVRHLFVDEFQDVNPAQFRLLRAWLGARSDLFVVGDPRQAVYAWNGADPTLLERIEVLLPGTTVLPLDDNHRSTPQVLGTARAVLPGATTVAAADMPDGPAPALGAFDDEVAEAAAAVRWLRLAHGPGRAWSHMAVLARTARRLDEVAAALARAAVPHRRLGAPAPASSPGSAEVLRSLRRARGSVPLRAALTDATEAVGAGTIPSALARMADEYALEDPEPTVGAFVSWIAATVGTVEDDPRPDGPDEGDGADAFQRGGHVVLSTFHRAKGLEWPVVAIVGLEDGTCPIAYASGTDALEEERRLLYVAVTRAEEELWCSWATRRTVGGIERTCSRSSFLDDVGTAPPSRPSSTEVTARVAELRSRLAAAG
jgi:DNA helicase-2/ATP-dependent DNA helicase PcrA